MNLLLVNKFYPPKIGGVECVVRQHARFLREEGYSVTVLCCSDHISPRTRIEDRDGIRVVRCASMGTLLSMPVAFSFPFWLLLLAWRANLLVTHVPFPLGTLSALAMPRRLPLMVFWHSDIVRQKTLKWLVQPIQRLLCSKADRILTTSPNLARSSGVISRFAHKVGIVPLSVPMPAAPPADADETPRPSNLLEMPAGYGLFLGRLCYYKGIDVLIDALSLLQGEARQFPVIIVGEGPLKGYVQERLRACGHPNVFFLPRHVSDSEKEWLLRNSSFLLFPSTERSEAFGIMQLEAERFGVPVVNTSLPTGVPWVSCNQVTGLTVPPKDPHALAEAIRILIENPQQRSAFGEAAKERVASKFEDSKIKNLLLSEIENVLHNSGKRAARESSKSSRIRRERNCPRNNSE